MWMTVLPMCKHGDESEDAMKRTFQGRIVLLSLVSNDGAHYLPMVSEGGGPWKAMSEPDGFTEDGAVGLSSLEHVDLEVK